jgi:hypothetical protein
VTVRTQNFRIHKLGTSEFSNQLAVSATYVKSGTSGLPLLVPTNVHLRFFLSLSTHLGYLSQLTWVTWALKLNQNIMWCIPLDSTAYLYLRSKIDTFQPLELLKCVSWRALIIHNLRSASNLVSITWASDLNLQQWMKTTSSSIHRLHNVILDRLMLPTMNTIHDQNFSSWIQRKFLHSSIGASPQTNCPSPSLVPRNTIPNSNSSSLHHIEFHVGLYDNKSMLYNSLQLISSIDRLYISSQDITF